MRLIIVQVVNLVLAPRSDVTAGRKSAALGSGRWDVSRNVRDFSGASGVSLAGQIGVR